MLVEPGTILWTSWTTLRALTHHSHHRLAFLASTPPALLPATFSHIPTLYLQLPTPLHTTSRAFLYYPLRRTRLCARAFWSTTA